MALIVVPTQVSHFWTCERLLFVATPHVPAALLNELLLVVLNICFKFSVLTSEILFEMKEKRPTSEGRPFLRSWRKIVVQHNSRSDDDRLGTIYRMRPPLIQKMNIPRYRSQLSEAVSEVKIGKDKSA